MAAADAGQAAEAAPHRAIFLNRLPEVTAARRLKPTVPAQQRTKRQLVEDHASDKRSRCHAVAHPAHASPRSPQPVHRSPPTPWGLRCRQRRFAPLHRGLGRRCIPRPGDNTAGESDNHLLHLPRTGGAHGHGARSDHDDEVIARRQQRPHLAKRLPQSPLPAVSNHRVANPPRHRQPQPRWLRGLCAGTRIQHQWPARRASAHRIHASKVSRGEQACSPWKAGPAGGLAHHHRSDARGTAVPAAAFAASSSRASDSASADSGSTI
jgi:hypothetical protein